MFKSIFENIGRRLFHSGYKCPICSKRSPDSQEIFDCLYNHIYNNDKYKKKKLNTVDNNFNETQLAAIDTWQGVSIRIDDEWIDISNPIA